MKITKVGPKKIHGEFEGTLIDFPIKKVWIGTDSSPHMLFHAPACSVLKTMGRDPNTYKKVDILDVVGKTRKYSAVGGKSFVACPVCINPKQKFLGGKPNARPILGIFTFSISRPCPELEKYCDG